MKKNILKTLSSVGVDGLDADILLYCYENPQGLFSHQVVEYTGAQRGMVDRKLDRLAENGYLSVIKSGKRNKFYAVDPVFITQSLKRKAQEFEKSSLTFEDAISAYRGSVAKPEKDLDVVYYTGVEGLKDAQMDQITVLKALPKEKRQIYRLGFNPFWTSQLPKYFENYTKKRVSTKIAIDIIIPETIAMDEKSSWDTDPKRFRRTKFVPEDALPENVNIIIYADTVAFQYFADEPSVLLVRNAHMANMQRYLFDNLWNKTK